LNRRQIDTLIIDLDNTIYDWFAIWYASFCPIYRSILDKTKLPEEIVQNSIREVHQKRRTSEYTFLLEEAKILDELRSKGDIREAFKEALYTSHEGRDRTIRLYPSVFRSLWAIKETGTRIIAYTESMAFYSAYRLKRVGLDGVIDVLFSPQDHDTPAGTSVARLRSLPDEYYELQVTEAKHTPPGELKPNPRVLLDIIRSVGALPERCAYVGDSLFKDVAMARDSGVFDVHAEYGESQRLPEYDLLRKVSHWTDEDVERERRIVGQGAEFKPSATLKENFSEIFMYCDFVAPAKDEQTRPAEEQELQHALEGWKTTVEVQKHFNDLEMTVRNFAITVTGALIASMSFTYQFGLNSKIFGVEFPAGTSLMVAAIFAWLGFYFMDRYWYHVLLKGAVDHAGKIETQYGDRLPAITLGTTISKASGNVRIFGIKLNSTRRLNIFYLGGAIVLSLLLVTQIFAEFSEDGVPPQEIEISKPVKIEIEPADPLPSN
jgi:phosphoglycolate phosphatase-like HAD superfamily hydrolase